MEELMDRGNPHNELFAAIFVGGLLGVFTTLLSLASAATSLARPSNKTMAAEHRVHLAPPPRLSKLPGQ